MPYSWALEAALAQADAVVPASVMATVRELLPQLYWLRPQDPTFSASQGMVNLYWNDFRVNLRAHSNGHVMWAMAVPQLQAGVGSDLEPCLEALRSVRQTQPQP